MFRPWTPPRRHDPELMDSPGLPEAEVADAYRVLGAVNRQLGNSRTLRRELERFLEREPIHGPISVLDVGTGAGDLPRQIRATLEAGSRSRSTVVALDRDPTAVSLARRLGVDAVRADALRLPLADRSVDLVTAIKFAPHFSGPALARLLAEMARVARRQVLVIDIRRHRLAYWGFIAWSRLFTRNRLVRYDGPLSVLRAFTPSELLELAAPLSEFAWEIRQYPGFQLVLAGRRRQAVL